MSAATIYRQIWIDHNGPIPKDELGRSFDIHHINGNRNDNRLENLQCVSIQEHYDIHWRQCDYYACLLIADRLSMTAEGISKLASSLAKANNKKLVECGTHNWLKDNIVKKQCEWCHLSVQPGVYARLHGNFCKSNPNALRWKPVKRKECEWCHAIVIPGSYARYHGVYCKSNPNALPRKQPRSPKPYIKKECEWCHQTCRPNNYTRYHGDKCKEKPMNGPRRSF